MKSDSPKSDSPKREAFEQHQRPTPLEDLLGRQVVARFCMVPLLGSPKVDWQQIGRRPVSPPVRGPTRWPGSASATSAGTTETFHARDGQRRDRSFPKAAAKRACVKS